MLEKFELGQKQKSKVHVKCKNFKFQTVAWSTVKECNKIQKVTQILKGWCDEEKEKNAEK